MAEVLWPGSGSAAGNRFRRQRDNSELGAELTGPAAQFVGAADRLRRRLFDVGLRLHILLEHLDEPDTTRDQTREVLTGLVDELDELLRESGLAMLALTRDHYPLPVPDGQSHQSHDGRDHHS